MATPAPPALPATTTTGQQQVIYHVYQMQGDKGININTATMTGSSFVEFLRMALIFTTFAVWVVYLAGISLVSRDPGNARSRSIGPSTDEFDSATQTQATCNTWPQYQVGNPWPQFWATTSPANCVQYFGIFWCVSASRVEFLAEGVDFCRNPSLGGPSGCSSSSWLPSSACMSSRA